MTPDTRVEACQSTWQALRFAVESNEMPAIITVLKAAGVKLLNKTLQMSYDETLHRYDIPVYVISDPTSYEFAKTEEVGETKDLKV